MRRIGLIGGMSWESTAEYYRLLNALVRERLGGLHSAECLVYSVDFAPIEEMQAQGRWDEAADRLVGAAQILESAGAEVLLLCTNTMHKVADAIEHSIKVPLLHIVDSTAAAVRAAGLDRVGLLGTAFTMEQDFYRDRLAAGGVEVLAPHDADRALVHRTIYDELCLGLVRDETRTAYQGVIERLIERGAQGVALACTEIELLISAEDSPVPVFPSTRLHVEAAVEQALDRSGG